MSAPPPVAREQERFGLWQIIVLLTSVGVLILMAVVFAVRVPPEVRLVLEWADLVACFVFLIDFVQQLRSAPDKVRYLLTVGWIDLLASIPVIDAFRAGRVLRLVRLLRLVRALRIFARVSHVVGHDRAGGAAAMTALALGFLVFGGAACVLLFEGQSGNIRTASDALWWAASTISTVGYGDHYPTTGGGRLVAVTLMFMGVATFSSMTALVSSWVIAGRRERPHADRAGGDMERRILDRLEALHARLDSIERGMRR